MSWLGLWNKFKWIWIKITQLSYKKLQNGKHSILISSNWLWPGDIIGWCISWSTLAQVMACYPMAPCHYLNQFWLINWVLWHVPQCNFTWSDQEFNLKHGQEKLYFIIATSPRSQCINSLRPSDAYVSVILPSLVQIMACRLLGARHYLNQYWNIVNWTLRNKLLWNYIWNSEVFI